MCQLALHPGETSNTQRAAPWKESMAVCSLAWRVGCRHLPALASHDAACFQLLPSSGIRKRPCVTLSCSEAAKEVEAEESQGEWLAGIFNAGDSLTSSGGLGSPCLGSASGDGTGVGTGNMEQKVGSGGSVCAETAL